MIGYRNWYFDDAVGCLIGAYGAKWYSKMVKSDQEPSRDNQSGIYACKFLTSDVAIGACGAVDLSGKILIHSDDVIRAQYSTILWLTYVRYELEDEKEAVAKEKKLMQFCKDKDIAFFDSSYIEEVKKNISAEVTTLLTNRFNENTLTIPAMDSMFSTLSFQRPLSYETYAKVEFKILKDSLDYQILDKLSNRASIPYNVLLKSFNSQKNYFLAGFRRIECEESLYRIQKFVGHFDDGDTVYVFINDKGLEILDHIKHHCYYSYNTKDARFVYRSNFHVRNVFAYKTNGKYKILYNGKVSKEFSDFEDLMEVCRYGSFSCLCDDPIVEKEINEIGGYYELHAYRESSRISYTYYFKDKNGEYFCDYQQGGK